MVEQKFYPTREFYFQHPRSKELWLICYGMLPELMSLISYQPELSRPLLRLATYSKLLDSLGIESGVHSQLYLNTQLNGSTADRFWRQYGPVITTEYTAGALRDIPSRIPQRQPTSRLISEFFTPDPKDSIETVFNAFSFNLPTSLQKWVEAYFYMTSTAQLLGITPDEYLPFVQSKNKI